AEAAHAQLRAEQGRARPKTRAKNRKLERKQEHEPLGQLIVGDITARSEAVPAGRKAGKRKKKGGPPEKEPRRGRGPGGRKEKGGERSFFVWGGCIHEAVEEVK